VASVALAVAFLLLSNVAALNLMLIPVALIAAIGVALLVLVCMIKACQHEAYKLPLVGNWAERLASRC
jgi:uncharacterized membrane protein